MSVVYFSVFERRFRKSLSNPSVPLVFILESHELGYLLDLEE